MDAQATEPRRALVLHERAMVVDLIELTLNHGMFVVRAARNLAEAEQILAEHRPHLAVIDMDHDDSTTLLGRLGVSNGLARSVTPVLGLTRRGDLKTKLRAFDLGVDDILTMPSHRRSSSRARWSSAAGQRARTGPSSRRSGSARSRLTSSIAR
ncbi:MAG: response regulator transcription factor [Chloroflexota bacterium]|nr:MAG: response regulator transcription factor [Chloroflexota bacterium]